MIENLNMLVCGGAPVSGNANRDPLVRPAGGPRGDTIEVGSTHTNGLDRPLISVHFPKASGSSFRVALEAAFGKAVRLDSACDPVDPANPMWVNPDWFLRHRPRDVEPFTVVHGHLPIVKYDLLPSAYRVVMLREPVENLISIYYFWQHLISIGQGGHALFEHVKNQRLSLLEVAEIPRMRRLMSSSYFGGYDMRRFDVVGTHDNRTAFVEAVSHLIGVPLSADIRVNVTSPSQERENVLADAKLIAKLRNLLQDDIRFYEACATLSNGVRDDSSTASDDWAPPPG